MRSPPRRCRIRSTPLSSHRRRRGSPIRYRRRAARHRLQSPLRQKWTTSRRALFPDRCRASRTPPRRTPVAGDRLHRRRLPLLELEDSPASGNRGEGDKRMRAVRTRSLPGRELLRPGMHRARDFDRIMRAAALEPVIHGRPRYRSPSPKCRDRALLRGRKVAGS